MDDVDLRIVTLLQENARTSNAEIARQMGMAPSAILERVRKLEERGVIMGYAARVNPEAVGLGLLTWLIVLKLTRMVSAGSIAAGVVVGVLLGLNVPAERLEVRILGGLIVAFIIFAHRANVGRILRGEEHRFGMKKEPRATVAAAAVTADAKGPE